MKLKDVKVGDSFMMEKVTFDSGKIRLSPDDGQLICEATNLILFDMHKQHQYRGKFQPEDSGRRNKGGILMQLHTLNFTGSNEDWDDEGVSRAPFIFRRVGFKQEGPLATILQIDTRTDASHFREDLNFEVGGYLKGEPPYPSWHRSGRMDSSDRFQSRMEFWFLKSPPSFLNWINENPLEVK